MDRVGEHMKTKILLLSKLLLVSSFSVAGTLPNELDDKLDFTQLAQQEARYQQLLSAAERNDVYANTSFWIGAGVGAAGAIYALTTLEKNASDTYEFSDDGNTAILVGIGAFAVGYFFKEYYNKKANSLRGQANNVSQGISYLPASKEILYTVQIRF